MALILALIVFVSGIETAAGDKVSQVSGTCMELLVEILAMHAEIVITCILCCVID